MDKNKIQYKVEHENVMKYVTNLHNQIRNMVGIMVSEAK